MAHYCKLVDIYILKEKMKICLSSFELRDMIYYENNSKKNFYWSCERNIPFWKICYLIL